LKAGALQLFAHAQGVQKMCSQEMEG